MSTENTCANAIEELDAMLCKLDPDACVKFFSGMSEKERKIYVERAMQWYEINLAGTETSLFWGNMLELSDSLPKRTREQLLLLRQVDKGEIKISPKVKERAASGVCRLALTACAGLSELRKLPFPSTEHAFAIMRDRKPKHLDRWLDFACGQSPYESWELARSFEKDGISSVERGDGYWLAMALSLGQKEADELISYLQADSELCSVLIWKMLESDGAMRALSDPSGINAQVNDRRRVGLDNDWRNWSNRIENSRRASYMWRMVLTELAQKNPEYQEKIMDIVFTWLARLSSDTESKATSGMAGEQSPVSWFQSLHDDINLSSELRSKNASRYIGLLSLKDSSTLSWAIAQLQSCVDQSLPVDDLLANLSRVYYHKRKDPALAALKLVEVLEKNKMISRDAASSTALEGLEHSSVEVQKKVLSYLRKSKNLDNEQTIDALQCRVETLSGLVKKEVLELIAKHSGNTVDEEGSAELESFEPEAELDLADLKDRVSRLNTKYVEMAEIHRALNCLETDSPLPAPAALDSVEIPRLDPSRKIASIENVDDLIFLFLHVLETNVSADDVERLIDGLMRLNHIRPHDFDNRVSSLRKKLQPSEDRMRDAPSSWVPFNGISQIMDLQSLAMSWLNSKEEKNVDGVGFFKQVMKAFGMPQENPLPGFFETAMNAVTNSAPPLQFFSERSKALVRHVARRRSLPLLSAPTHQGGWIDPRVIPERLSAWEKQDTKPDKADLIQMLLRLAPEHRKECLEKIPQKGDEHIRAIRYALGDEVRAPLDTAELWIAAFRCREPRGSSKLMQERFPGLGPDSAIAAKYVENMENYKLRHDGVYGTSWNATEMTPLEVHPPVNFRTNIRFFPIELLHDRRSFWDAGNDIIELYFLSNREPYLCYLARRMAIYLDSQGDYWKSSWNSLFDPDISLAQMGSWVLVLGLSSKSQDAARLALDALIAAIEEDRIDGSKFGERMGRVYTTEKITLSRWITALREVLRISPLHLHFVQTAAEACVAELPLSLASKPPVPLIELLYDASLSAKYSIRNVKARNFLEQVQGKGKAAKLAKLLLELSPLNESKHRRQAAVQMLEARIQRAERWQKWQRLET